MNKKVKLHLTAVFIFSLLMTACGGGGGGGSSSVGSAGASGSAWKAAAAGYGHTVAIKSDGTLWTAGWNQFGQIGDGTTTDRPSLVSIATGTTWQSVSAGFGYTAGIKSDGSLWAWGEKVSNGSPSNDTDTPGLIDSGTWNFIAAGGYHTIAIKKDGTLWAWGVNNAGQLGNGTYSASTALVSLGTDTWQAVAGGYEHTAAIRSDGTLWAWGWNIYGQLGVASTATSTNMPTQVGTDANWQSVSAGEFHTAGIKNDGTLWAWGWNGDGQLGIASIATSTNVPVQVGTDKDWRAVAAGGDFTMAIKNDGTLWAWGYNHDGELGIASSATFTNEPVQIGTDKDWQSVYAGAFHAIAAKKDGSLYAWGYNYSGQLGLGIGTSGEEQNKNILTPVAAGSVWGSAAAGEAHIVSVKSDGKLWSTGWNKHGQLGNGTNTDSYSLISISTGTIWQSAAAGYYHTLAIKSDGTLWAWGGNASGQLGNGTNTDSNELASLGTATWQNVSAGDNHTIAIKSDGTLWAWGGNALGQLGIASIVTSTNVPVQVGTDTTWLFASAGVSYTVAIKKDGTLWAWGDNSYGRLGIASTATSTNLPVQVGTDTNWQSVATGSESSHTVAIKTDGTLWAWGNNADGELGDGTRTNRNAPVQIGTDTNWQSAAVGMYHTVAIKSDGTLWTWGYNYYGELGNGTNMTGSLVPVQIGTDMDWALAAAGDEYTLAIKRDGSLWSAGSNYDGELGIGVSGEEMNKNTPTRVP